MKRLTDEQLAAKLQEGDHEAFGLIIDKYESAIVRYANRLVNDHDIAEDVAQEAFIKTYRDIQSFDTKRKFSSWLYRIAHNEAIDYIRKNKRIVGLDEAIEVASEIDLHKTAQKNLDKSGTKDKLEKAINKISSKYREAVILRFYEEKEYEEIAEILHVPIGTVGTYISRAKKELKEQLSDINIEDYL